MDVAQLKEKIRNLSRADRLEMYTWRRNIHPINQYRVVVGQVGIVFDSNSRAAALRHFDQSVSQSKIAGSATAQRSVALFKGYEVIREYHPEIDEDF